MYNNSEIISSLDTQTFFIGNLASGGWAYPQPKEAFNFMEVKRNCLICNKEFFVIPFGIKKSYGKYCSWECYIKHKGRRIKKDKKICQTCGREFEANCSEIKRGGGKFCSHKCYSIGRENKIKQNCLICGKEFKVTPFWSKHRKFCSNQCKGIWQSKNRIGEKGSSWKGGKIKRICKTCGIIFPIFPSRTRYGWSKFCSLKCLGKWRSKNQIGKNNPLWRGGKSFEPYGIGFNNNLKEQIRQRDNYICQLCGLNQGLLRRKLHIHHIDYNKKNNIPKNLISLCSSCHLRTNINRDNWIKDFQKIVGGLKK